MLKAEKDALEISKRDNEAREKERPSFWLIVEGGVARIEGLTAGIGLPYYEHIDYDIDGAEPKDICKCRKGEINSDHYHY